MTFIFMSHVFIVDLNSPSPMHSPNYLSVFFGSSLTAIFFGQKRAFLFTSSTWHDCYCIECMLRRCIEQRKTHGERAKMPQSRIIVIIIDCIIFQLVYESVFCRHGRCLTSKMSRVAVMWSESRAPPKANDMMAKQPHFTGSLSQ